MAEGSPSAAVHEHNGPLTLGRIRQYKGVAVRQMEFYSGEKVAAVKTDPGLSDLQQGRKIGQGFDLRVRL